MTKRMWRVVGLFCSLLLGFGVCPAQDSGTESALDAGKRIYDHKCAQCHGEIGDGNGIAKPYFLPAPRDFTFGLFKIRTTPSGSLPNDDDLEKIIKEGMPYTGMPAWPGFSEREMSSVVSYVKTFAEGFDDPDLIGDAMKIPKPPRFSEESVQRGRVVYEENKCFDCHGDRGRGDGKSSATLRNDWDEPIRPADLTKRWTFRGGSSRQDIYRTFTTGLNGTPMPSYADLIAEEDRWHLVNYVYSLSRDDPEYSTLVIATAVQDALDVTRGRELFDDAPPALFPVFGQVIEPGRNFFPSATAIEVKAVYNETEIAFLLTWNDMTADTSGSNNPSIPVPRFDPEAQEKDPDTNGDVYSDAVAVQTPSRDVTGSAKPYFLFGDARHSVDLWFADLAAVGGEIMVGRGSQSIEQVGDVIPAGWSYADGQWNVVFKRDRHPEGGLSFDEGGFVPVAFSVWDGFNRERGNRRGLTAWYHVYLQPVETESKTSRIAGYGVFVLLLELAVITVVRRRSA